MSTKSETDSESGDEGAQLKISDEPHNFLELSHNTNLESPFEESPQTDSYLSSISTHIDIEKTPESDQEPAEHELWEVTIEEHFPEENDEMSGALSQHEETKGLEFCDKNVISECLFDLSLGIATMPYKTLRRHQLFRLDLPLDDLEMLRLLPEGLITTYRGVGRAMEYVAERGDYSDEALLEAIGRRGGFAYHDVIYPEDIVPWERPDSEGEWEQGFDEVYWKELQQQGKIWEEVYVP